MPRRWDYDLGRWVWNPDVPTPELDRQALVIAGAIIAAGEPLTVREISARCNLTEAKVQTILSERPTERLSERFVRSRRATTGRPFVWGLAPGAGEDATLYACQDAAYLERTRGLDPDTARWVAAQLAETIGELRKGEKR